MVNRVELQVIEQVSQVGSFYNQHSPWREKAADPVDDVIHIGDMSHHVIGEDDVGSLTLAHQPVGDRRTKKRSSGGNVPRLCCPARGLRRIDSEDAGASDAEELQQITIVA